MVENKITKNLLKGSQPYIYILLGGEFSDLTRTDGGGQYVRLLLYIPYDKECRPIIPYSKECRPKV